MKIRVRTAADRAMKPSDVFLLAAQRIVTSAREKMGRNNVYACHAIKDACCDVDNDSTLDLFVDLFRPTDLDCGISVWWEDPGDTDADQEARRLALLFAWRIALDMES